MSTWAIYTGLAAGALVVGLGVAVVLAWALGAALDLLDRYSS